MVSLRHECVRGVLVDRVENGELVGIDGISTMGIDSWAPGRLPR